MNFIEGTFTYDKLSYLVINKFGNKNYIIDYKRQNYLIPFIFQSFSDEIQWKRLQYMK